MAFSQEVSGLLLHLFPIFAHPPKKNDPQHARATVPEIQDRGLRLFDLGSAWLQRELFPSRVKA
jgi:hypothetical protein